MKTSYLCVGIIFSCVSFTSAANALTCKAEYLKHYAKGAKHAAMAVTGGHNPLGNYTMSCGTSWGYETKSQAIKEALRQCRRMDRKYHDAGKCQITHVK
jgi:hypothetical protein